MSTRDEDPIGTFCMVLHSHLPWLAGHGRWPVGEEWLYQAWAHSYLPLIGMLERFAARGVQDVLTLGITPVLAAQLDDPHSLRAFHHWLGDWHTRSHLAASRWRRTTAGSELATAEHRWSAQALDEFEQRWRHGASPVLRPLTDAGTVELLGGPATHPFQPLLDPALREFALHVGLADTRSRLGTRPAGIWAPECAYGPGLEHDYAATGVHRFLVEGTAVPDTSAAHTVGDSGTVCFGRDVEISDKVWSPDGYPGHPAYRDFHTHDHEVGLKPARITGHEIPPESKAAYEPHLAREALDEHVADFVATVVRKLREHRQRRNRPGLVVAAFDTELFGHWWFEGPTWLERVLRALPQAGVRVSTLRGAVAAGHVEGPMELPAETTWGAGNDFRVWSGDAVTDIAEENRHLQERVLGFFRQHPRQLGRDHTRDQLLRETLLALASDWAFMISHDTAGGYAHDRAARHTARAHRLLDLLETGRAGEAAAEAQGLRQQDGVFGGLDTRMLRLRASTNDARADHLGESGRVHLCDRREPNAR